MYCAHCGSPAPEPVVDVIEDGEPEVASAAISADVEIARINADRDIALARIGAGVEKHVATAYSDADAAAAEAKADILDDMLEPPPADPPADVTVVVDDGGQEDGDGDGDLAPPDEVITPDQPAKKANAWFG